MSDYIYLDGGNATLTDGYLKWYIPAHYFKNYKANDDVYISLVNASFIGKHETQHDLIMSTAEILCDLNINANYVGTDGRLKQLALCTIDLDQAEQTITCNTICTPSPVYRTGVFNDVTLAILYQGDILDFTTVLNVATDGTDIDKGYCKFLLRIDYKPKINNRSLAD
jgi:hypothetical protein